MPYLKEYEIGWLAGIIDGDGCISINHNTNYVNLRLVISMTCEETIKRIKRIAGCGSISQRKRYNRKILFNWVASGLEAIFVLKTVKDYIFTKRNQLLIALEFEKCMNCNRSILTLQQKELAKTLLYKNQELNAKGYLYNNVPLIEESKVSVNKLYWLAGIIDSEGCISINKRLNGKYNQIRLRLIVTMTHEQTINRIKDTVKCGSVNKRERDDGYKDQYYITLSSWDVINSLKQVKNFTFTKRRQCNLALQFQSCLGPYTELTNEQRELAHNLCTEMEILNSRGSDVKISEF